MHKVIASAGRMYRKQCKNKVVKQTSHLLFFVKYISVNGFRRRSVFMSVSRPDIGATLWQAKEEGEMHTHTHTHVDGGPDHERNRNVPPNRPCRSDNVPVTDADRRKVETDRARVCVCLHEERICKRKKKK